MASKKTETTPDTNGGAKLHPGVSHNVYMPFEKLWLKTRLEEIAKLENRSVSEVSIMAFEAFVKGYGKK
jgi:hypothetical protein